MLVSGAEHELSGHALVVGDDRADQAALTARGQLHGVRDAVVRQQGADRPERLDVVGLGGVEVVAAQQHGRQEGTAVLVGADDLEVVRIADDQLRDAAQRLDRPQHLVPLVDAGQGAHRDAVRPGAPTTTSASFARVASTTSSIRSRGTKARRMAVHFWPALTVISVTSWSTNSPNSRVSAWRRGRGQRS